MNLEDKATVEAKRWVGVAPLFNPEEGVTILAPPGNGPGYWSGAVSTIFDGETKRFYLYYRLRNPRDPGNPKQRGFECRIAESKDGVRFADIWSAVKDDFGAISIERASLVKTYEGIYRLYISFEDIKLGKWKIDLMEADKPANFDPRDRVEIMRPIDGVMGHIKDPYVMIIGGLYYMFINYHPIRWQSSGTALALSGDGVNFNWVGEIFPRSRGWDVGISRITSIVRIPPLFYIYYDGGETMRESCEERAGLAISFDLKSYYRLSDNGPLFVSPHGTGSLRYIDALKVGDEIYCYYEYTREDGSHELRLNRIKIRS